ncbi:hypothetical protein Pfo_010189 [Paulownia fortunei]|nr:hypothetical protein Pfo_010189 [Paulownia fortunei]
MLIGGDCELNLELGIDDSLRKSLTQTMLNQEEIFTNQVLELHRLYQIQKIMMKEIDLEVSGGFDFREESLHSFGGPFSKNLKYESLAKEMKLSEVPMMCLSRSMKNYCLPEHRIACLKRQQRPLDLELPASCYINDSEELLNESYGCVAPEVSVNMKYHEDKVFPSEELKLYLRIDGESWQKGRGNKIWEDKIVRSPSQYTISLDGSTETSCGGDLSDIPELGYATHVYSGAKHVFESSGSFRSKSAAFDRISRIHSLTDGKPFLQGKKHFNEGVGQCHGDLSCSNLSARRRLFASHEVGQLDLNKALPDESSVHSIEDWITYPSKCTFSGEVGEYGEGTFLTALQLREPNNNCFNEPSALDQQDLTNSTVITSSSNDTSERICGSTMCAVDFVSICGPPSDTTDPGVLSRNFKPKNAAFSVLLPDRNHQKISVSDVNAKNSKEDTMYLRYSSQELVEGTDSNRSRVSCKFDWIIEDKSSNINTTKCVMFQNSESSLVAKKHFQQNVVPSSNSEMKYQSSNQKKDELAEVDSMVKKGAVSLIFFSLECLARNQDCIPEATNTHQICNVERDVPQSSSESYESIVLKQPECSVDDYCESSTPFELNGLDEKDHSIKLKRGRRMKDFQKEILPSLASLSRHEICEDIKIMEVAIRSREYKKYGSKTTSRSDCFSSVRMKSRRSRLSCASRRYYS